MFEERDDPLGQMDLKSIFQALDGQMANGASFAEIFAQDRILFNDPVLVKDPVLVYKKISETTDRRSLLIEQFISYLEHAGIRRGTEADAIRYIPMGWNSHQHNNVLRLRKCNAPAADIALLESLTLENVALYVNCQYRESSTQLAALPVGSSQHRAILKKASFWSEMDVRIGLAV